MTLEPAKGRIRSIESGAVDGPGIRCVVFTQSCPLRCIYCHNPDTWDASGGTEITSKELFKRLYRFAPYFAAGGGVTVSGGEPLMQAEFVASLFKPLRAMGIHTALDTSGIISDKRAESVLENTDLVIADIKFVTDEDYRKYVGISIEDVKEFLRLTEEMKVPLWVRHVVVPGLNDNAEDMKKIKELAKEYGNLKKIEFLPFHNMCREKYEELGLDFPLKDTPNMDKERLTELEKST